MESDTDPRFVLFGAPRLVAGAASYAIPETAPAYLGLYLAAQAGWSARESVSALLWPDLPEARGQHNLRVALNRLSVLLVSWGMRPRLIAERRRLRLDVASDLADFRRSCTSGDWVNACAMPTLPMLQGVQFSSYPALSEWLELEREAVRRSWRKAISEAARTGAAVEPALARYLESHPGDAEIAVLEVSRLAASRRLAEAQDVLGNFKRAAAEAIPAVELRAAARHIEQAAAGAVAAGGAGAAPWIGSPLIGRDAALAQLDAAMAQSHWVTLVGPGGVGKTALAFAWVERRRAWAGTGRTPRVARIELGERSTPAGTLERIVIALAGRPPLRAGLAGATQALARTEGLIVLDGLDQIATTASDLARQVGALVSSCPSLSVLATSRSAVGSLGPSGTGAMGVSERVLSVRPLGTSRLDGDAADDSARLFRLERLRIRGVHADSEGVAQVQRIIEATGGLPLAIRLAASWSRWLELDQIAVELDRSVRGTPEAFDPTLHACLQPSWRHLDATERRALGALSLFPASFAMSSATWVARVPAATIEALASASLVETMQATAEAPTRLRLHPVVRGFAARALGDVPEWRREVIGRFLAALERALGPRATGMGRPMFELERIAPHIDEIHAAWPLAIETGAAAHMIWLAGALVDWHEEKGTFLAGLTLLGQGLPALDESVAAEAALLARLHASRARLLYRSGDYDAAEQAGLEGVRLAERTGQTQIVLGASNMAGLSCWMQHRLGDARAMFERCLKVAEAQDDMRGQGVFSSNLALIDKSLGDYASAELRWRRALEIDRALGLWSSTCTVLNNLANLLRHLGRLDECEPLAEEALRLSREHAQDAFRPFAWIGLALLRYKQGRIDAAREYLNLLDSDAAVEAELPARTGTTLLHATMALDAGDGAEAARRIDDALQLCTRGDDAANRAEAMRVYGRWLWNQDRRADARKIWHALLASPRVHATLKDEVRDQLAQIGEPEPPEPVADLDWPLAVEHAMRALRAQASG